MNLKYLQLSTAIYHGFKRFEVGLKNRRDKTFYYQLVVMGLDDFAGEVSRHDITSICRETAKSLDMSRSGSRWRCEVTKVDITNEGFKEYRFYVHDKNSGREYEAQALVENEQTAKWEVQEV